MSDTTEKTKGIKPQFQLENKMSIEIFNDINKRISDIIEIIDNYEGTDIDTAKKSLLSTGISISSYYYCYKPTKEDE